MMLVHDSPSPPAECRGRLFIDRSQWMQIDPALAPRNPNYPFSQQDRATPYHELRLVGLYFHEWRIDLWFDVDLVDEGSIESVKSLLSSTSCGRPVRLEFFKDGWMVEQHPHGPAAVERISEIMLFREVPLVGRTVILERDLSELQDERPGEASTGPITTCFRAWRENPEADMLKAQPLAEELLAFKPGEDGTLLYHHIGARAPITHVFGSAWREGAIGQQTDIILGDHAFHDVAVRGIRSALENGLVCYETVLASLDRPEHGREWVQYRRIHLPFADHVIGAVEFDRPEDRSSLGFLRPK